MFRLLSRPDWLFSTDNAEVAVQQQLNGAAPVYVRSSLFAFDLSAVTVGVVAYITQGDAAQPATIPDGQPPVVTPTTTNPSIQKVSLLLNDDVKTAHCETVRTLTLIAPEHAGSTHRTVRLGEVTHFYELLQLVVQRKRQAAAYQPALNDLLTQISSLVDEGLLRQHDDA